MKRKSNVYCTGLQIAVALLLVHGLARIGSATPQARGLSLTQIEKLIKIHTPDDVVAQEVRSRGLDFTPTPRILDELQQRGAGQATLAAVRERMPIGTLEIQAPPGSQVAVDGTDRGTTDPQGRLVLSGLPAGEHRLVVSKGGYRPGDFQLTLANGEYKRFPIQLGWAGGFLTVLTGASGVSIDIERIGHFSDRVTDLPCLPGNYDITVSGPRYQTVTKTATVVAGQGTTVSFSLEADPQFLRNAASEVKNAFAARNYAQTIRMAQELLVLDRQNKEALSILATSYFMTDSYDRFLATANLAIEAGGLIQVALKHHHAMGSELHSVLLIITARALSFDPQISGQVHCNYKAFTTLPETIVHVEVTRNTSNEIYLNIKFKDPKTPGKIYNFNFAEREAYFVKAQKSGSGIVVYTGNLLQSRPQAQQALDAIATLLKKISPGS